MVNVQLSPNLAQAFRIALQFWFGRVLAIAVHTAIPLRTRICSTSFVLTTRFVTVWTLYHLPILAHSFSHSPIPKVWLRHWLKLRAIAFG